MVIGSVCDGVLLREACSYIIARAPVETTNWSVKRSKGGVGRGNQQPPIEQAESAASQTREVNGHMIDLMMQ